MDLLINMFQKTGFHQSTWGNVPMWIISMVFLKVGLYRHPSDDIVYMVEKA